MGWTGRAVAGVWGAEGGVRVIEGKSMGGGHLLGRWDTVARKKWVIKEEVERRFGMRWGVVEMSKMKDHSVMSDNSMQNSLLEEGKVYQRIRIVPTSNICCLI